MSSTTDALGAGVPINSDYLTLKEEVKSQSELDKDAFIQLLVTQMKYQDPLEPMDNSQMLAQLAQFTALEQMMNVAQVNQKQLASNLIGKYVEYAYKDPATGQTNYYIGKVDYVNLNGESPVLGIGDKEVSIDDIYNVVDGSNIQANTSAFDVIGKTVQATMEEKGPDGNMQSVIIEGEVQKVTLKDGTPYVVIGTGSQVLEIPYSDVKNIVENTSVTGREVTAEIKNEDGKTETITGIAEYIKVTSEGTFVFVNGKFVDFNDITSVK